MKEGDTLKSLWLPESSPRKSAVMAKLTEECGELTSILGRCQAQGFDGMDPDSGRPNQRQLEDELADVIALARCAINILKLDNNAILKRASWKEDIKLQWLNKVPA